MSAETKPAPSKPAVKVLRIGVVVDGKIAQERLIRAGEPVTVGEGPRNTFVLAGTKLGASHTVFAPRSGNTYALSVPEWVDGKIATGASAQELSELRRAGATRVGDNWVYPLSEQSRGKVTIGAVTVLFQFVPAPPESVRQVHSGDFRPKWGGQDDPLFLAMLGIFSAVGSVALLWALTTEVKLQVVAPDAEYLKGVLSAPRVEPPPEPEPEPEPAKDAAAEPEPQQKPAEEAPAQAAPSDAPKAAPSAAPKTAESGAKAADDLLASIGIEALPSVGNASGPGTASGGNVEALVASMSSSSGPAGGSSLGSGIVGGNGTGSTNVAVGSGPKVAATVDKKVATSAPVKIETTVAPAGPATVTATSGTGTNVEDWIKKNSARIKSCADASAKANENLKGIIGASWMVTAGKVSAVRITKNETGDASLEACVVKAVGSFRFDSSITAQVGEYQWRVGNK
jgi:hypothetical protein